MCIRDKDYTLDRHKKVDDYPYGGGAGMVMQAQPIYDAWQAVAQKIGRKPRTVYLTPQGNTFQQEMAKDYAKEEDLVLLCGHYEEMCIRDRCGRLSEPQIRGAGRRKAAGKRSFFLCSL